MLSRCTSKAWTIPLRYGNSWRHAQTLPTPPSEECRSFGNSALFVALLDSRSIPTSPNCLTSPLSSLARKKQSPTWSSRITSKRLFLLPMHQEKKSSSGHTGCVRTHQALGTLWTHPGRTHTAPNAKRTGNVNSDAARHGTVHSDAVCQGAVHPDAARHGIYLLDGACQGIFLLGAAVSGHFPSGRSRVRAFSFWAQTCQGKWRPDDACHGTTVMLSVKARNIVANTLVAFANT